MIFLFAVTGAFPSFLPESSIASDKVQVPLVLIGGLYSTGPGIDRVSTIGPAAYYG
jgi:hypothetical protein